MTLYKTAKMLSESTRGRSNAAINLGGHQVLGATIFGAPIIIDSRSFSSLKLFYLPSPSNLAILKFPSITLSVQEWLVQISERNVDI